MGDGFGTLFVFRLNFWYRACLVEGVNREMHESVTGRQKMNNQKYNTRKSYDNPIPKPPDELFDNFLRNMEDRLITRRFDVDRGASSRKVSRTSESR